ncbi:MAG: hypothetical protein KF894_08860 [Labilithrix sp.]|nr:hypothetical protein [Labilithrix sp.]
MQPDLFPPGNTNVPSPDHFDVVATFGTAAIANYFGLAVKLVRNDAGNFTLTLPQPYRRVTRFAPAMQVATGTPLAVVIKTDTVATNGKLVIETRSGGTPTDPASGDKLYLTVGVSRDMLLDRYVQVP